VTFDSPSDYTLMITNLPKGEFTEKDLRNLFDNFWDKKPLG
jgi:RNA recognition motif-containing protein